MPITFSCPGCEKQLSVPDSMSGKAAKCPCGTQLQIPSPVQEAQSARSSLANAQEATRQNLSSQATTTTQRPSRAAANAQEMNNGQLNPDFQIQCLQCGIQYPMRPDLIGQTVACRCGAAVRFEDPLGEGGVMLADPLDPFSSESDGQPVAYQSMTPAGTTRTNQRQKEDDVLKMYIKEDDLEKHMVTGSRKKTGSQKKTRERTAEQKFRIKIWFGVGLLLTLINVLSWLPFLDLFVNLLGIEVGLNLYLVVIAITALYSALVVLVVSSIWETYIKANEKGWMSIVPILNALILIRIIGAPTWWIFLLLIPIVNIIVVLMMFIKLAECFGQDTLFGFGLGLLGFVFWPILGWGDAKYLPKKKFPQARRK